MAISQTASASGQNRPSSKYLLVERMFVLLGGAPLVVVRRMVNFLLAEQEQEKDIVGQRTKVNGRPVSKHHGQGTKASTPFG